MMSSGQQGTTVQPTILTKEVTLSQQTTQTPKPIVVHHLSDIHYTSGATNAQEGILVKYKGYLEKLEEERQPDLIIITGDLTATGTRQDLNMVATILRTCFPRWQGQLYKHVFVAPGPEDVNWEEEAKPGLGTFYDVFREFALPSAAHEIPANGTAPTGELNVVAYAVDTCYQPDDLGAELKSAFTKQTEAYTRYVKEYQRQVRRRVGAWGWLGELSGRGGKKARGELRKQLRKQFLAQTEGAQPLLLDAGRVDAGDLAAFARWSDGGSGSGGLPPADALKILITHHPLAIQPEQEAPAGGNEAAQRSFQALAKLARGAGFHLALHGHIHKPQVLSDLSIFEGVDAQHPMRQIGAASMGEGGIFNEITAVYREEQGRGIWRLELRLVDVQAENPQDMASFVLLNPAETADNMVVSLTQEAQRRNEFERRMRTAMRKFAELVYLTQPDARPDTLKNVALPQAALLIIETIIREVIFDDFVVRVRLLLKNKEDHRVIPKLTAAYLEPSLLEGPETLDYPASIAGWSLAIGRTLMYRRFLDEVVTEADIDWLRRTEKLPELLKILEALMEEAGMKSYAGNSASLRYQTLHTKLMTLNSNGNAEITGGDVYQASPNHNELPTYPDFVCVPYPLRPRGGALPQTPEVAVLDVGVRPAERRGSQREAEQARDFMPFTPDRVEMLESLMEMIGLILCTSSALGKPGGVWDDRFKRQGR